MTNIIRATVPALDELLGVPFPILDHGFIRVIDYMGNDEAIVQAARVSYGQGTKTVSSDAGLIDYLMRHRHTTPFEMCEIKLHIKLPIFVARQWIRHRTASVNEVSGRYSKLPAEFFVPECEAIRAQSKTNTQGRDEELPLDITSMFLTKCQQNTNIFENYERAVEVGIARELARINLPLSTYTEWYWKIDLHNLLHFLNLRCDSHAQYEIRTYANKICDLVAVWVPTAYAAFVEYRLNAMQLSASALSVVKNLLASRPVTQESSGMSNREWRELMKILER